MRRGRGVFIAGTDTGVGKTMVAGALLHGFAKRNVRAIGMKPVAAGAERRRGRWVNEDVEVLRGASGCDAPLELINPYCFPLPVAPHIAASEAGVAIRWSPIKRAYDRLAALADCVVVEGVGGVLVPLGSRLSAVDIPTRLGLPVILVVGLRLGCINHALLSAESLRARGLRLAGWVGNRIDPAMSRFDENVDTLRRSLRVPLLGLVPHLSTNDLRRVSGHLDFEGLTKAF